MLLSLGTIVHFATARRLHLLVIVALLASGFVAAAHSPVLAASHGPHAMAAAGDAHADHAAPGHHGDTADHDGCSDDLHCTSAATLGAASSTDLRFVEGWHGISASSVHGRHKAPEADPPIPTL